MYSIGSHLPTDCPCPGCLAAAGGPPPRHPQLLLGPLPVHQPRAVPGDCERAAQDRHDRLPGKLFPSVPAVGTQQAQQRVPCVPPSTNIGLPGWQGACAWAVQRRFGEWKLWSQHWHYPDCILVLPFGSVGAVEPALALPRRQPCATRAPECFVCNCPLCRATSPPTRGTPPRWGGVSGSALLCVVSLKCACRAAGANPALTSADQHPRLPALQCSRLL